MKVSKDQHLKAQRKCLSGAAAEWSVTKDQMPGTNLKISHSCSSYKFWPTCTAEDKRGVGERLADNFFLAKMAFSRWRNLEQPSDMRGKEYQKSSQVKSATTPVGEPNVRAEACGGGKKNVWTYQWLYNLQASLRNVVAAFTWNRNVGKSEAKHTIEPHFSQYFPSSPKICTRRTFPVLCPNSVVGAHGNDLLEVDSTQCQKSWENMRIVPNRMPEEMPERMSENMTKNSLCNWHACHRWQGVGFETCLKHTFYRCPILLLENFFIQFWEGKVTFWRIEGYSCCKHYFRHPPAYIKGVPAANYANWFSQLSCLFFKGFGGCHFLPPFVIRVAGEEGGGPIPDAIKGWDHFFRGGIAIINSSSSSWS